MNKHEKVLSVLRYGEFSTHQNVRDHTGFSFSEVSAILSKLIKHGRVEKAYRKSQDGGRIRLYRRVVY